MVYTGAGVSTAASVPDFRGEGGLMSKGILGLKEQDLDLIMPTFTHLAIKKLLDLGTVRFVVSSNHDNLHVKSGVSPDQIAELFGNAYIEKCVKCGAVYTRKVVVPSLGRKCDNTECGGRLVKTGVRFGQATPQEQLRIATEQSKKADLALVFGSSMSVSPFCILPPLARKMVICNLQETPYDNRALKLDMKCDDVMKWLLHELNVQLDPYNYIQEYVIGHTVAPSGIDLYVDGSKPNEPCSCVSSVEVTLADGKSREMQEEKYSYHLTLPSNCTSAVVTVNYKEEYGIAPYVVNYSIVGEKNTLPCILHKIVVYN